MLTGQNSADVFAVELPVVWGSGKVKSACGGALIHLELHHVHIGGAPKRRSQANLNNNRDANRYDLCCVHMMHSIYVTEMRPAAHWSIQTAKKPEYS